MKDSSPRTIALLLALAIAALVSTIVLLTLWLSDAALQPLSVAIIAVLTFSVSYSLIYLAISRFIYEKIRIIYKNIHRAKRQKANGREIDMSKDVLGEVEEEVLEWAEERTNEIERLKEQEKFRREFIGNLAHELKTPVFSIQGYILTLLEGGLEDPEINVEFLTRASNGVDRMTHIIEDLDIITKFESGRIELELSQFNLVELVAENMRDLEMKAGKRNVKLQFDRRYDKPLMVEADENRIGQVVANLLANAINYSKDTDGVVELRFFDVDENVMVEVSDNGLGIEEKHLPRLFERFYRVDKSRARNQGGTGLGLAIVKHIIESHDQTIYVRSAEEVGSTFSFTLRKA